MWIDGDDVAVAVGNAVVVVVSIVKVADAEGDDDDGDGPASGGCARGCSVAKLGNVDIVAHGIHGIVHAGVRPAHAIIVEERWNGMQSENSTGRGM